MSTPTDPSSGTIVKSDRTGRVRYSAQYKREVLASFASSSLSAPVFARQCGIKYPTFAAWLAAGKNPQRKPTNDHPVFLVAEMAGAVDGGSGLEVHLPGGAIARVAHPEGIKLLAELLRHLA
jgi:hypothetical protein